MDEPDQLCRTILEVKGQLIGKSQWFWSAVLQLTHAPRPRSTTPGLHPISTHQMAPPVQGGTHPITAYYSFVDLERMKG